jgi:beta-galactosidase
VHVQSGVNRKGRPVHYYFNYSSVRVPVKYTFGAGKDLLTSAGVAAGQEMTLGPWDLAIIEEGK